MRITIESTLNGAVVSYDDGENVQKFSYKYDDENVLDAQGMFADMSEFLGLIGSRYAKQRLYHVVRHGDKYECSGCDICTEVL